jgi:hypothetical protein
MTAQLKENFEKLKGKVLEKKQVLAEILRKRGKKSLYEYAKEYISVNLNNPIKKRREEFIGAFKNEVELRLGKDVAEKAAMQLENHYYVSTVDHHGPVCHPFFINGNLLSAAPFFEHSDPSLTSVIVLPCANVSLNNSSFPRGLLFHSYAKGKITEHRIPILPAKDRLSPVYNYRSYTKEEIERFKKAVDEKVRNQEVHPEEAEKLNQLIDEIYMTPEALNAENYSVQSTITNFKLWKKFFGPHHEEAPDLIYIEQEWIVAKLLIDFHLHKDTIVNHFLFDDNYSPLINKYFEGIQGAFERQDKYGTYMFWAMPPNAKYRIQLWKQDKYLVSEDGTYKIELTPDAIKKGLESKELIPGMMLTYIVLSFYYGLKCLGGFSQVNYLTYMKDAYLRLQVDYQNYRSIEVCARAQTKELGGDMVIAFMEGPNNEMIPATGLDLILYGHKDTWPLLIEESKEIGVEEAINPLFPEFYTIVYPDTQRDPELLTVTASDITKLTNLDKKIKACVKIKVHDNF